MNERESLKHVALHMFLVEVEVSHVLIVLDIKAFGWVNLLPFQLDPIQPGKEIHLLQTCLVSVSAQQTLEDLARRRAGPMGHLHPIPYCS